MRSALSVGALAVFAAGYPAGAGAQAPPAVATWTGASSVSSNWSDAANWSPAVVPTSNDVLEFPMSPSFAATNSVDDLGELSPSAIRIETSPQPAAAYSIGAPTGTTLSLGAGGLSSTDPTAAPGTLPNTIDVPLRLSASQTWAVSGAGPTLAGPVSGPSAALTIDLAATTAGAATAPGTLSLDLGTEVGPLAVVGADHAEVGTHAATGNGFVALPFGGGLNGSDGSPVSVTDAGLFAAGPLGPLTVQGGELVVGMPAASADLPAAARAVQVKGAARFDASSALVLRTTPNRDAPGARGPLLSSTSTLSLGGAQLVLVKGCGASFPAGDQLTLAAGAAIVGTFTYPGTSTPIGNGSVVAVHPSPGCNGGITRFRITSTSSRVRATALGPRRARTTLPAKPPRVGRRASRHANVLRLRLDCAGKGACTGRASVVVGRTVVAAGRFVAPAGRSSLVAVPLTPAGRLLLRRLGRRRRSGIVALTLPGGRRSRHPITL